MSEGRILLAVVGSLFGLALLGILCLVALLAIVQSLFLSLAQAAVTALAIGIGQAIADFLSKYGWLLVLMVVVLMIVEFYVDPLSTIRPTLIGFLFALDEFLKMPEPDPLRWIVRVLFDP